ncbi:MAG: DUF2171 domain-containing protein [Dehalococcoidia bacterium]
MANEQTQPEEHQHPGEHREMQPDDAPTWQVDIAEGSEVVTSDGHEVGTVKEIRGGYFKLNVHLHPDYWLQRQFVTTNAEGRVTMSFTKDDLDNYKVKDVPDAAVVQGQDMTAHPKQSGDDIGFGTEYVGGAVPNPSSETMRAVEAEYDSRHRP